MKLRLRSALVVALAIVLTSTIAAFAAWLPAGTGTGNGAAVTVDLATNRVATATGNTSIHITWAAPGGPGATPTQYVVRRTAPTTSTVCTVTPPTFACDDTGLNPGTTYTYTVESRVGTDWSSGQSPGFTATTTTPTFIVTLTPGGSKTAGVNFTVQLTATTDGVTTDTGYTGSHAITFSGPGNSPDGSQPNYPNSVNFTAGVGTATVRLKKAETVTLTADDGSRSGNVNVTVVAAAGDKLLYTNSSLDCSSGTVYVGAGGTWTSKVTVVDQFENPTAASSPLTVNLSVTPNAGTLTPTSLAVPNGQSETSGALSYTRPGNNNTYRVHAQKSGLTQAVCRVRK